MGGDPAEVALAAAHAVLPTAHAADMLAATGKLDRISALPRPGVDPDALARRLRGELSDGLEVITGTDGAQGTQSTVRSLDDGVNSALFAFAGVTVLVASLAVANIYSVLLAQRTRELALLRLVGARRIQVLTLVVREALLAAAIGTSIGLAGGVVLARTAVAIVRPLGVAPALSLSWSMVVAACLVGGVVSLAGSAVPALRASRHVPLRAVSDTAAGGDRTVRGGVVATCLAIGAVVLAGSALTGGLSPVTQRVGAVVGAALVVAGIGFASRWLVGPLCAAAARPLVALIGQTARLGVGNVARSPSRATAAGSTLMVTMVLVGAVATFGSGVRQGVAEQFETTGRADLFVERRGLVRVDTRSLFAAFGHELRTVRDGAAIVSVDGALVGPSGVESQVAVSGLDRLATMIDLGITRGSIGRAALDGPASVAVEASAVILSEASADSLGAEVGDLVELRSTSGREVPVEVVAIYRNTAFVGPAIVSWPAVSSTRSEGTFEVAALDLTAGASVRATEARLRRVADTFPRVRVHTPADFEALNASVVETVLRILGVLLSASVGIGVLGLGSTLALSVHERRREIVMLRAVGARRSQIRSIIGLEAAVVSALAVTVGLAAGAGIGVLATRFAPETLAVSAAVPWVLLGAVGATSVCVGWLVGVLVARRATRIPPALATVVD